MHSMSTATTISYTHTHAHTHTHTQHTWLSPADHPAVLGGADGTNAATTLYAVHNWRGVESRYKVHRPSLAHSTVSNDPF